MAVAHLQREIGDELFAALVSSDHTETVRKFATTLVKSVLPIEMTIGGRTYEILSFLRGDEKFVVGHIMVERAKEMNAHLGKDDYDHLLKHQEEIPVALRGKVYFVFTDYRRPGCSGRVCDVCWAGGRWVQDRYWLGLDWNDRGRVLRRKSAR